MNIFIIFAIIAAACGQRISFSNITDALGLTNNKNEEMADRARENVKQAAIEQAEAAQRANEIFKEYGDRALDISEKALAEQRYGGIASLLARLGLAGMSDLSYRQLLNAVQAQQYPYQTARLGALQALPILQSMAGAPAYRLPQDVTTVDYVSGVPDYRSLFEQTARILSLGQAEDTTGAPGEADTPDNIRVNVREPAGSDAPPPPDAEPAERLPVFVQNVNPYGESFGEAPPPGALIVRSETTNIPTGKYDADNLATLRDAGFRPVRATPIQTENWMLGTGGGFGGGQYTTTGYATTWEGPNGETIQVNLLNNPVTGTGSYQRVSDTGGASSMVPTGGGAGVGDVQRTPGGAPEPTPITETTPESPTIQDIIDEITGGDLFGFSGSAGAGGDLTTTQTPLEEFTPDYSYEDSPLYQFRKKESDKAVGRALRARGLYGSETGALIDAQEKERIAAEEAENQYRRIADIVNIGLGGQASAGALPATAGANLTGLYSGLGQDVSSGLNAAAQARSGLYSGQSNLLTRLGTGMAENEGQIGAARAQQFLGPAQIQTPQGNSFLGTIGKLYGLYSGFGGGVSDAWNSAWGSGATPNLSTIPYAPAGVNSSGFLTGLPNF